MTRYVGWNTTNHHILIDKEKQDVTIAKTTPDPNVKDVLAFTFTELNDVINFFQAHTTPHLPAEEPTV